MKKAIFIVTTLLLLPLSTPTVFAGDTTEVTTTPTTVTSSTPTTSQTVTTDQPLTTKVVMQNLAYSPSSLTIQTGTMVTWVNQDSDSHTVTADSANGPDSETIRPG